MAGRRDVDEILKKYGSKIEQEIKTERNVEYSKEFKQFKEEAMPNLTRFERLCKTSQGTCNCIEKMALGFDGG